MLKVGDVGKFPQALDLESMGPFLGVSKWGPCLTAIEEDGGDWRLVQFGFAREADGVAFSDSI